MAARRAVLQQRQTRPSTSRVPSFSVGNSTRPLTDITSGNPRYQLPRTDCLQPSRDLLRCHQCSTSGSQMTGRCWPLVASLPSDPARRYKHAFTEYGSWCSVSRQATESSRAVFSRHTAAGRPARTVDGLLMLEEAKLGHPRGRRKAASLRCERTGSWEAGGPAAAKLAEAVVAAAQRPGAF